MSSQEKISFIPAVLMTINVMIGVGIYFNPQLMAAQAGSSSFLGWGIVAIILLPLIWVTALAARMFPGTGGFYNYGRSAFNESVGFVSIWSYLIGYVGMVSTQILALYSAVKSGFPESMISENQLFFNIGFILVLMVLSMLSITWISRIQSFVTVIKLLPLLFVLGLLFFYWNPSVVFSDFSYANLGGTITFALFGYMGFESCTSISSYLKGGPQEAFKVILTAFVTTAILYSLFHLGLINIMGAGNLAQVGVPGLPSFLGLTSAQALGWAQLLLSTMLIISYSNGIYGNMLSNVTNLASAAEKNLVFGKTVLTKLNRFNRPVLAVIVQCLAAFLVITFFPNITVVGSFANMAVVITLTITTLAVLAAQIKQKTYGAGIVTLLSFVACAIFAWSSWSTIGTNNNERTFFMGILGTLIIAGFAMFRMLRCCSSKTC